VQVNAHQREDRVAVSHRAVLVTEDAPVAIAIETEAEVGLVLSHGGCQDVRVQGSDVGVDVRAIGLTSDRDHLGQDNQHEAIATVAAEQRFAGEVELSLQQIELELKMFRMIKERRPLPADEEDRKTFLESLREFIVADQRKKVA